MSDLNSTVIVANKIENIPKEKDGILDLVLSRLIELEKTVTKQNCTIEDLKKQNTELRKQVEKKASIQDTLASIKTKGLKLGNNWVISEEGDVLVCRDVTTSQTRDSRFAMYRGINRDL